jgi:hypothetical protein
VTGDLDVSDVDHGNRAGGVVPVGYSATTLVPLEYSWKSFAVAIRPASLET